MNLTLGVVAAPLDPADAVLHAAVAVIDGRLSLGRLRNAVGGHLGTVAVSAGLRSACWIGPPGGTPPVLGRLAHHGTARLDARGRVTLDRHVRGYLGVGDPAHFSAVLVSLGGGGVLVVPVEDIDQRLGRVSPA